MGLVCAGAACSPNAFDVVLTGQTTIHGDPASAGAPLTRIPAIGSFASIDFGASEEFRQYQATKDAVQSIKVTAIHVKVVAPGTQGFDFLDNLSFFASNGSTEVMVAGKADVAALGLGPPNPTLALDVNPTAELRDFLGAPSVSISAQGSGREPAQDTTLEATVKLRVVLKVL
ncbi:MAG TPA: hypothetical protein VND93_14640 [Myxococcales bacterium]|nr:hypothetical protein [Myxococcales bacterium]